MPNTSIFSKSKFIEMLSNQLNDRDIIVLTSSIEGSVSVNTKKNVKKVTFGFAADAFKQKDDIRHIAFGQTPVLAFSIVGPEYASEITLDLIKQESPSPDNKQQ